MASWTEMKAYVQSNYEVADSSDEILKLVFRVGSGNRTQIVLVGRMTNTNTGEEWVGISSPIGSVGSVDIAAAARSAWKVLCGGIVVIADMVYLHHSAPLVNLDPNEFERPLSIVVEQADQIEAELLGVDEV